MLRVVLAMDLWCFVKGVVVGVEWVVCIKFLALEGFDFKQRQANK